MTGKGSPSLKTLSAHNIHAASIFRLNLRKTKKSHSKFHFLEMFRNASQSEREKTLGNAGALGGCGRGTCPLLHVALVKLNDKSPSRTTIVQLAQKYYLVFYFFVYSASSL